MRAGLNRRVVDRAMEQSKMWICTIATLFLCVAFQASIAASEMQVAPRPPSSAATDDIQKTIHDYLLAHPEVLIESLQTAKRKEEQ